MKRRIKKQVYVWGAVLVGIIICIILGVNYIKKINSISYQLEKKGYAKEEVSILLKLKKEKQQDILKREYEENLVAFLKEKYFIYDNLDRYLLYKKKNKDVKTKDVVSLVNVGRDDDFYKNVKKTDTSKENLILVNKYYALEKEFVFEDLAEVSILHCYGNQKIRQEAYDKFKSMFNDAKKEDITIIINSSYREYSYQENLWNRYADKNGEDWADSYAARAGHSEHQTGLAIDVTTYGVGEQEDFEQTDAFTWLQKNAYKYGFILRYPKGKENITGYAYESWHYRYVGVNVAEEIHKKGITFDEYYAYYLK